MAHRRRDGTASRGRTASTVVRVEAAEAAVGDSAEMPLVTSGGCHKGSLSPRVRSPRVLTPRESLEPAKPGRLCCWILLALGSFGAATAAVSALSATTGFGGGPLDDATATLGDATAVLGNATAALGNATAAIGNATAALGNATAASLGFLRAATRGFGQGRKASGSGKEEKLAWAMNWGEATVTGSTGSPLSTESTLEKCTIKCKGMRDVSWRLGLLADEVTKVSPAVGSSVASVLSSCWQVFFSADGGVAEKEQLETDLRKSATDRIKDSVISGLVAESIRLADSLVNLSLDVVLKDFNSSRANSTLQETCARSKTEFTMLDSRIHEFMNYVEGECAQFLAESSDATRKVLEKVASGLSGWHTWLVWYYTTCKDIAESEVEGAVQGYVLRAGAYQEKVAQWFEAWQKLFEQDLNSTWVFAGFGSATSTEAAFRNQCQSQVCVLDEGGNSSDSEAGNGSLCASANFTALPDFGGGSCKGVLGCADSIGESIKCAFPATFEYSLCSGDPCSKDNRWVLLKGYQQEAWVITRDPPCASCNACETSCPCPACNTCQTSCAWSDSVHESSVWPKYDIMRIMREYAVSQARVNMISLLSPLMYLSTLFPHAVESGRDTALTDSFRNFTLGPISYMAILNATDMYENPADHDWAGQDLQVCGDGCVTQHVDSDACKEGVAGVSVVFGDEGSAWSKPIQSVALYGSNARYPHEEPCYVFGGTREYIAALGRSSHAYASYLPGGGLYQATALHFRTSWKSSRGSAKSFSMVHIDFELKK